MHFESRARRRWIFFLRACSFIDSGKRDSRADREQLSQHSAVRPMSIIDTVIAYRSRALYLLGGYLRRCLSLLWKRKSPDNTFSELICTTLAMARPLLLHSLNKKRTRRVYKPRQFTVFFFFTLKNVVSVASGVSNFTVITNKFNPFSFCSRETITAAVPRGRNKLETKQN